MIADGCRVELEYTMTLADGSVVESNVGKVPFSYVHGQDRLLPAMQAQLTGHAADDVLEFRLSPEECFGPVQPDLFKEVPIREIPKDARKTGAALRVAGYDGPITVSKIGDEAAVLDFNHHLAGKDLHFSVRVLAVNAAAAGS